jgi:hypothetical protein
VLHERSFARYLASVTISTHGSGMATVALAFAVLDFGGATYLGIVLLAREIPIVTSSSSVVVALVPSVRSLRSSSAGVTVAAEPAA